MPDDDIKSFAARLSAYTPQPLPHIFGRDLDFIALAVLQYKFGTDESPAKPFMVAVTSESPSGIIYGYHLTEAPGRPELADSFWEPGWYDVVYAFVRKDPNAGYDVDGLKQLAYGDVDKGVRPLDLDNDVNEAAMGQASNVNVSGGIDAQVDFLVQMLGFLQAQTTIHDRAKEQR